MPYSDEIFDDVAHQMISCIRVERCLDIGAGTGKYGMMVRQYHPGCHIIGVEVERDYISKFNLKRIYDEIWVMPAQDLIEERLDDIYDIVVLGDCLEHLRKSDGVDLLNFLVYRTSYILAIYPERYIQGEWQGYRREAHISFWHEGDFSGLDYVLLRRESKVAVAINAYRVRSNQDPVVQELLATFL
jgi:predicted TPR repeat methyltransferase